LITRVARESTLRKKYSMTEGSPRGSRDEASRAGAEVVFMAAMKGGRNALVGQKLAGGRLNQRGQRSRSGRNPFLETQQSF
jgi:hypothetical protein